MLLYILFILFFVGVGFLFGFGAGARTKQKVFGHQFMQLESSDIRRFRSQVKIPGYARKTASIDGRNKQVEWTGIRQIVDEMFKDGFVKKTFHTVQTAESIQEVTLPDIIYEFEARVVDPDIISPMVQVN